MRVQKVNLPILVLQLPDALLFDCDGVLVDTERDGHRVSFNEAFKRKGEESAAHSVRAGQRPAASWLSPRQSPPMQALQPNTPTLRPVAVHMNFLCRR